MNFFLQNILPIIVLILPQLILFLIVFVEFKHAKKVKRKSRKKENIFSWFLKRFNYIPSIIICILIIFILNDIFNKAYYILLIIVILLFNTGNFDRNTEYINSYAVRSYFYGFINIMSVLILLYPFLSLVNFVSWQSSINWLNFSFSDSKTIYSIYFVITFLLLPIISSIIGRFINFVKNYFLKCHIKKAKNNNILPSLSLVLYDLDFCNILFVSSLLTILLFTFYIGLLTQVQGSGNDYLYHLLGIKNIPKGIDLTKTTGFSIYFVLNFELIVMGFRENFFKLVSKKTSDKTSLMWHYNNVRKSWQ